MTRQTILTPDMPEKTVADPSKKADKQERL